MSKILKDLFIVPDIDDSKVIVTFTAPQDCSECSWSVLDQNKSSVNTGYFKINSRNVKFEANIAKFNTWSCDDPYLYTLQLIIKIKDKKETIAENFGMRKIHVSENNIYVNNEKVYIRGYIRGRDAHDHPNFLGLPLEEYYGKNIKIAKIYGFNLIRFHSRVPAEECFIAADKLGIFIHIEIRDYYGKYQKERSMMNDEGELISNEKWVDIILKYRNHPSLMVYCMGNEIRHPGTNPQVAEISNITKSLDPTRLFIDTCAHGEFDRDHVDIDVQHMSYYYPFGKNYDMFNNTYNWHIYGSAKGVQMISQNTECKITRALTAKHPVLAHEICHYVALRDINGLESKFNELQMEKPWWLDELKKLIKHKGLEKDYTSLIAASKKFQFLSWKLGFEAVRRSPLLCGFHFLQLSDTEKYENSNGIVDCFDDSAGVDEKEFLKFNSSTVILADLPRRTFFEKEKVKIPVFLSHFSKEMKGAADLSVKLSCADDSLICITNTLKNIDINKLGRYEIATLEISMPEVVSAKCLDFKLELICKNNSQTIENNWNIWLFPNRPIELEIPECKIELEEINLAWRYPQIMNKKQKNKNPKLLIANRFTEEVFKHLDLGGDVLLLYRVPVTRDRKSRAAKEKYYLPATWDRFKGVIWDRGTNCGGFIRPNHVLTHFPNESFIDLQFSNLIDDCDKIILDDFPCDLDPVIQGIDKSVRDRFDVYTYKLSGFQPGWTMRKFAYLFEIKVGRGKLLITGFNFTGLNSGVPETCAMFESLIKYISSSKFNPVKKIDLDKFTEYLHKKGQTGIIKERKMTQFWQLNDSPLESDQYWKESEKYLAE
ncbi:MAG: hypothetical protein A2Y10_00035 [Planctomycetes bacterium GWF2_41_51]|nr:MAG: hypothetical protein A2Y10_00035 [Planctomycetes bacterium GWF2_41_51]HBG28628.1 hypothetical protein [Phycisphaerales bacterium]